MNNFERASLIRRMVENKAYQLLKDCKEPEKAYDGSWYMKEYWKVDIEDLFYEVVVELDGVLDFEEGDEIDQQIKFHCEHFLDSDEYLDMVEDVRREWYEYKRDQRDIEATNRAHMPTWKH